MENKELKIFENGEVADANDINHNFNVLLERIKKLEEIVYKIKKAQGI